MPIVLSKFSGKFLPEVSVGDSVNKDDTICRINVWGTKLKIVSPTDGTVARIFPQPAADVERDDQLFDIKETLQAPPPPVATGASGPKGNGTGG